MTLSTGFVLDFTGAGAKENEIVGVLYVCAGDVGVSPGVVGPLLPLCLELLGAYENVTVGD